MPLVDFAEFMTLFRDAEIRSRRLIHPSTSVSRPPGASGFSELRFFSPVTFYHFTSNEKTPPTTPEAPAMPKDVDLRNLEGRFGCVQRLPEGEAAGDLGGSGAGRVLLPSEAPCGFPRLE